MMALVSSFIPNVTIGNAPLEVSFNNTSSGPFIRVQWDFGDGSKSTEINPTHVFESDGNFIVSLTVFAADGSQTVNAQTITVLSSEFLLGGTVTTQQALFTHKRFEPGQVAVKRTTTTGSTFSSDVPLYDNTTFDMNLPDGIVYSAVVQHDSFTGGQTMTYHPFNEVNDFLGRASDITMAVILCPTGTASGSSTKWADVFPGTGDSAAHSKGQPPVLFYKVNTVATATTLLTVDRQLPNMLDDGAGRMYSYFFGICGSTSAYGPDISSANMNMAVNIGIDSSEQLTFPGLGWTTGNSRYLRGFASYVGYTGASGASFAVIHPEFSGNATVNRWYPGLQKLVIPWVLWHDNTKAAGLILYDSADPTQYDAETSLRFRWLRDGTTKNDTIVGRIFHDKKMVLITDPELTSAMIQTNDRSWTLPAPTIKHVNDSTGWASGTSQTGVSWYWTYRVVERDPSDGSWPTALLGSSYLGFGEANVGLPCQYIQRIDIASGAAGAGYFTMTIPKLNHATGGTGCVDVQTEGFVASWVELMCATGASNATGPDMTSWRIMTGAPAEAAWTGNFTTNNTITIDNTSSFRRDVSGKTYSWSATTMSGSTNFYVGNEKSLFGFMSGNYASDVYKMSAVCVGKNNEFNNTQNQTYNADTDTYVYVTEVALYNESNELLMVGKLSRPIKKNTEKFVTVKIELDL